MIAALQDGDETDYWLLVHKKWIVQEYCKSVFIIGYVCVKKRECYCVGIKIRCDGESAGICGHE